MNQEQINEFMDRTYLIQHDGRGLKTDLAILSLSLGLAVAGATWCIGGYTQRKTFRNTTVNIDH